MAPLKGVDNMMKQTMVKTVTKDINSPYAKYNSRGQLTCIVCSVPVKSAIIWHAHVNKKSHKENLIELKEKQAKINKIPTYNQRSKDSKKSFKRPISSTETKDSVNIKKAKGILKTFTSYGSSSDSEPDDIKPSISNVKMEPTSSTIKSEPGLPVDFFDSDNVGRSSQTTQNSHLLIDKDAEKASRRPPPKPNSSEVLPEGFFDDPVLDAKARKVEYRDKNEEEWSSFMKEVSQAEVESQQIIAEDKEEAALETQIEQTNEQINCLQRIVELDKVKKCQLEERSVMTNDVSDESSDEEFTPLVWRTKSSKI